ncbi:MAG: hypothetical protein PHI97_21105 [Desulfobulbus sp.]|jgi:hypothetical protein|nr:hypothetical protein [Desulfobulbus sp.]
MESLSFENLFKKIKKISRGKNQKGVAQALGISPQAITDAKRKNKIPETWFDMIEEKFGLSKDELIRYEDRSTTRGGAFLSPSASGQYSEKDSYDQIMDEFFELIKEWQVEENGRSTRTAIDFIQEFPKRFEEMAVWQKKRKEENIFPRITEIKLVEGN